MKQKGFTKVFIIHLEILASSKFAQSRFSKVSSFFGFIEFVLELSVFGHVAVSSFFFFFTSISGFLDLAFKLANGLLAFRSSSLFGIKLRFKFTNARFEFLNLLLTALQGNLFSFIET